MDHISIKIKTVNAAFDGDEARETARILRELADKLEQGREPDSLLDNNGNKVGTVEYK